MREYQDVSVDPIATVAVRPEKALTIGAYGETVAAYRYLVLSEKAQSHEARNEFAAMADEEQDHKQRLQRLLAQMFPDADFFLTPEEKDLVVVGPRLLDVRDEADFARAMRYILGTEQRTAHFYRKLSEFISQDDLRRLFSELAEEGVEHYHRLRALARVAGVEAEADAQTGPKET